MVFNPPVPKDADGEGEPVVVTVNPARSGDAYIEQAKRAAAWIGLLVVVWLWQRLMCHFGLPPNCDLPMDALEVLTDLLTLLVFGLTQVSAKPRNNSASWRFSLSLRTLHICKTETLLYQDEWAPSTIVPRSMFFLAPGT